VLPQKLNNETTRFLRAGHIWYIYNFIGEYKLCMLVSYYVLLHYCLFHMCFITLLLCEGHISMVLIYNMNHLHTQTLNDIVWYIDILTSCNMEYMCFIGSVISILSTGTLIIIIIRQNIGNVDLVLSHIYTLIIIITKFITCTVLVPLNSLYIVLYICGNWCDVLYSS